MPRKIVQPEKIEREISIASNKYGFDRVKNLRGNLALPSYVHGYSLAVEYMYNWFKSKFPKDFFRGGIYIDGKNVLDDYKRLNDYAMRNIVKGENPRARMAPSIEYDWDREGLDLYTAPPEIYLKRSGFQDAFFKDYERDMFLGFAPRGLRMNVNYKVRLNSRSQQLDTFNKMELDFRNGATQREYLSVDFHVPKYIMIKIADRAGFDIVDGEVVDIIEFIHYLNAHSELPFLFKLRAINRKAEFFIRVNDLYTHIAVKDKLQLDDGERDGKLDFNFHIEMNAVLDMPIPHYYAFYSAEEIATSVTVQEQQEGCVALYSINIFDIPKVDEHGWNIAAQTDYQIDKGDMYIDLSTIFQGNNPLAKAINNDLAIGVSPSKYINIKIYTDEDLAKEINFRMNWKEMKAEFEFPSIEQIAHIAIYYNRDYINQLEIEQGKLMESRINK